MESPEAVLLPDLFSPDEVKVGQLLCDPLCPHLANYLPPEELSLTPVETTKPWQRFLSLDKKGSFLVTIVRLLSFGFFHSRTTLLHISAEEMQKESLKNVMESLKKVCDNAKAKTWISDLARGERPFYFVTGVQTLKNARVKKAIANEDSVGGYLTVPLESTDLLPVKLQGQLKNAGLGLSDGTASGVFGLEVLKAKWSFFGKDEEPKWADKPHWKWSHERNKGAPRGEEGTQIGLELESVGGFEEITALHEALEKVADEEKNDPDDE